MCHDAQLVLDSLWDAKPVQFDVTNHRQAAVEFLGATDNTGSTIEDPMQPVCRGLWLAPPPSLRISSTTFTECAPKAMEFAEIMQNNGHYAVQGHRFWYQSKAHMSYVSRPAVVGGDRTWI